MMTATAPACWARHARMKKGMRSPVAASLVIGLFALFVDLGVNYQNILSFFPYFVAGSRIPRSLWHRHLARPAVRVPFGAGQTFIGAPPRPAGPGLAMSLLSPMPPSGGRSTSAQSSCSRRGAFSSTRALAARGRLCGSSCTEYVDAA